MQEIRGEGGNKTKATRKTGQIAFSRLIFAYEAELQSLPAGWSHRCGSIWSWGAEVGAEAGTASGTEFEDAETHVSVDKKRSMPRKVLPRRREIVR